MTLSHRSLAPDQLVGFQLVIAKEEQTSHLTVFSIFSISSVGKKDSVTNAIETGEFVYNLATLALGEQVNMSSATLARGESEFALTQLSTLPSTLVSPPRIAQTPVSMECIVTQYQQLKRADGQLLDTWMVMGEVVMVHIDESALHVSPFPLSVELTH